MMILRMMRLSLSLVLWLSVGLVPALAAEGLTMTRPENLGGAVEKLVTMDELRELPQVTINVDTEWYEGTRAFSGPLARDVVQMMGKGTGTMAHLTAVNDYAIDVPLSDFEAYDVILALDMDGHALSIRDKGPIWVMYPMNDFPELRDPVTNGKLIWQLVKLEVQ